MMIMMTSQGQGAKTQEPNPSTPLLSTAMSTAPCYRPLTQDCAHHPQCKADDCALKRTNPCECSVPIRRLLVL